MTVCESAITPPADRRRAGVACTLAVVVVYLLAWTGLDALAGLFQAAPDVSVWYPPTALDMVLLLIFGLRYTPALLVNMVIHVTVTNPVGLSPPQALVYAAISVSGYAGGAAVLRHGLHIDPRLPTQRDVGWFVIVACGAAPLGVATAQVVLLATAGLVPRSATLVSIVGYWAGAATGVGMLAPPLLVVARRWTGRWSGRAGMPAELPGLRVSGPERAAQLAATVVTVWAAYGLPAGQTLDYTYLIYVPLIWVAVRGGFAPITVVVLLIDVGAAIANGGRPLGHGGIALQFGLITLTLVGLLLGGLITQRRVDAERHRQSALHDELTGLPNRALFGDRLAQALSRADHQPHPALAVLFLDLDRFKQVNDSLGHAAGDQLLVEVAARLVAASRPLDSAARLGGDEFGLLVEGLADPGTLPTLVQRVLATLAAPYQLDGTEVLVAASVGSVTARGGATAAQLLREADVALHHAKREGGARHTAFWAAMQRRSAIDLTLESALRRAVARDEIEVVFQPVFTLPERRLVVAEALARWTLPDGRGVAPTRFIGLAEDTGLIDTLGARMLERACAQAARWPVSADTPALQVAVNVSPVQLRDGDFPAVVAGALASAGLPACRLILEITERQGLDQEAVSTRILADLAAAGVHLMIDDFGTGYSSLSYLRRLPLTGLKIDKSFVGGLPNHADDVAIVKAVLALATELHLGVTAEGVETRQQLDFLTAHGCARAQGFLLGRPASTPTPSGH